MKPNQSSLLSSVKELGVATATVLLLVGILTLISGAVAGIKKDRPVAPDSEGEITLMPYRSTIAGDLFLYPTEVEEQVGDYAYTHGRAVMNERQTRKAVNWCSEDDSLTWQFRVLRSGDYQLRLRYACDEASAENEVTVEIDDLPPLRKTTRSTGGWDAWDSLDFGRIELESGEHIILVHGSLANGKELMRLEKVKLIPIESQRSN